MEADDSPVSNRRLVLCRNSVRGSMLNPTKIAMTPRETRRSSEMRFWFLILPAVQSPFRIDLPNHFCHPVPELLRRLFP
jgi:hypothetical protein